MIKATVLYGHPNDTDAFENYYAETHIPLVAKTSGIAKSELTKFFPGADSITPIYYRMAELWFENAETMQQAMTSDNGKAMAADLANFATGGVTILMGIVENQKQ